MDMPHVFRVRPLDEQDAKAIKEVALLSWQYTYRDIYTTDKILAFNNRSYDLKNLQWLAQKLHDSSDPNFQYITNFFVLEQTITAEIIGFAQVGFRAFWELFDQSEPETRDRDIELMRIYLHPDYIGKGLGNLLVEPVEQFVRSAGRSSYGVYVHHDNMIGRKFYIKQGFIPHPEKDQDDEDYLVKDIVP